MKKKHVILLILLSAVVFFASCTNADMQVIESGNKAGHGSKARSNIILVLGSSDSAIREARVGLACDLIRRGDIHFNKVILSGGCGAHGTDESNCEATDMERLLRSALGGDITDISIYREESSKSTVHNYCNSRNLKIDGEAVIQKGDTLYVVSSHYHALSVSSCFRNEGVDARYYYTCGGNLYEGIPPSLQEVAASDIRCFQDYNGIARNCGNPDWCGDK